MRRLSFEFLTIHDAPEFVGDMPAINLYNTVTTTLFTDAVWPNKVKRKTMADSVNSEPV